MAKRMLGSVDLLGLNEFGQNPGLNPIFGVMIGGGVSATTKLALRYAASGKAQQYADWIGFVTGALASGGLYLMKSTRHAAFASLAGAFFSAGLSALERTLSGSSQGVGIPMIEHLGIPQIQALNGLGMHQINPVPQVYGTIPGVYSSPSNVYSSSGVSGVAGTQIGTNSQPPVDLLGEQSPQQQQAVLLGGPVTSGVANHYGANLFGGRS